MDSPLKVLYMKGRYGKSAAPFWGPRRIRRKTYAKETLKKTS